MFKLKLLLYHSNCKFEYDKYHILSLVMPLYLVFKLLGMQNSLVNKYNIAGPRYTSYPTVPYWNQETFSLKGWKSSLIKSFKESNSKEGISIYIHLPFCESMCTFCGCNKRITKQHSVETIKPYLNTTKLMDRIGCELQMVHVNLPNNSFKSSTQLEKDADDFIVNMSQKSVKQRLAETLIYIHDNFGTNPDGTLSVLLSREDFANIVGTAIESAIRVISQFKKEGLISTTGKYIKI